MKIFYSPNYNIDFGIFNFLHPFDGTKYAKVLQATKDLPGIDIADISAPIATAATLGFANSLLKLMLTNKRYILGALALPYLPLIPFSFIDKKILLTMRWAVAGTLAAAEHALQGGYCWNLAGGYHHASRSGCEGFCIYNDIGITVQQLRQRQLLAATDPILIIDVDAHHGNGNARTFMDDASVTILDIYNKDIYPDGDYTKDRINIALPIANGTLGPAYLQILGDGLARLDGPFAIAFVVAGTDVLASDPLGGLGLTLDECVQRDSMVLERLQTLGVPAVFLGGGGYSPDSAKQIAASLRLMYRM
jgi:histone deacetylase 11